MKTKTPAFFIVIAVLLVVASACNKEEEEYYYDALSPVYMDFDEFRQAPKTMPAKGIKQAGKIYFKDDYIFVNEPNEGIHVINNANPSSPQKIAFYEIMGNVDMAIRGNTLFADSYIDLIAIDISDIMHPVEVGRMENAFPDVLPFPLEENLPYAWQEIDHSKGVIVGWTKTRLKATYPGGGWWGWRNSMDMASVRDSRKLSD